MEDYIEEIISVITVTLCAVLFIVLFRGMLSGEGSIVDMINKFARSIVQ